MQVGVTAGDAVPIATVCPGCGLWTLLEVRALLLAQKHQLDPRLGGGERGPEGTLSL